MIEIKNNLNIKKNMWIDYKYSLENKIVTEENIKKALNLFYSETLSYLDNNESILIIFKIKIIDGPLRNISKVHKINKMEFESILDLFCESWNIKSVEYNQYPVEYLNFTYFIIPVDLKIGNLNNIKIIKNNLINKNKTTILDNKMVDTINLGGYNLPTTMDITKWGYCDFYNDYSEAIVYKKYSNGIYYIKLFNDYLIADYKINDKIVISFIDKLIENNNLNSFIRKINNQEYKFIDGIMSTKSKLYITKFIQPLVGDIYYKNNFITMDLETRSINNIMEVYTISIYDGVDIKNFYISDYKDSEDLITKSILYLMKRKYNGHRIYLHNFSKFDGIFLLKIFTNLSNNINIIIKDNNIINLKIYYGENKYSITFRDSYLLLPSSLASLAISFNVENKGIFPMKFLNNENIKFDYIGKLPSFKYFDKINIHEYKNYCNDFQNKEWNLREESIKYCNLDVKILYKILDNFSKQIFNLFRINIIYYPTLSSLAFAIFRTIFLKDTKIPIITGELYNFIKKAYTGGSVDVYKPYGKFIYRYDVNSLYPYIMRNTPMPIGYPTFIEGNINSFNLNELAFIETEVETPNGLNIPLLQTRIKSKSGDFRTVSPLGKWTGVYTTSEIKKAKELGYKFKFIRAVKFEKDYIFKDFVDYFYNLKKNSNKNSSDYTIAKFILNSLSGRFALEPILDKHVIVDDNQTLDIVKKYTVNSILNLNNNKNIVSYKPNILNEENIKSNISIPISANITANARVFMYQFKNENLFYSDTDSIDTNLLIDPKYIGEELGQLKLEHIFNEAVYLAPKVYGGINPKYEIVKIKGLKNPISYKELIPLLNKNSLLKINQEKWIRDVKLGQILIKDDIYTLMVTDNKRKLIYNDENIFIDTKPLIIDNDTIIN